MNARLVVLVLLHIALILTVIWFLFGGQVSDNEPQVEERTSTLVKLAIIFRHGDRAPLRTYPTDPYPLTDLNFWPEGPGQLTVDGKKRMLRLGQLIRERYNEFLGENPIESYVRSSAVDRCLASAEMVMAGVYPLTSRQAFNPDLNWQPIPIHSQSQETDGLLEALASCDAAKRGFDLQSNANETLQYMAKKREVVQKVEKGSGMRNISIITISELYNPLASDRETGKRLPDWATDDLMREMEQMTAVTVCVVSSGKRQKRLTSGLFFHDLETVFKTNQSVIIDKIKRKAFFHAAHDINLVAILMAMNASDHRIPNYGSSIIFEMHEISGQAIVRIYYLRDPQKENGDIIQLKTRGCPEVGDCSVQQFFSGLREFITDEETHRKECGITPQVAEEVDCLM